ASFPCLLPPSILLGRSSRHLGATAALGCQALFRPPTGSATRSKDTAPCLTAPPPRGHGGRHRLRPCAAYSRPHTPVGSCATRSALVGMVASPPCWFLGRLSALHWASSQRGCRPASVPLWPFLPPGKTLQCTAVGLLCQGQASRPRCWRTVVAG